MQRLLGLMLILGLVVLNSGCSLMAPQDPFDTRDEHVTSYRGGKYWTAPGGFGPEFWARLP
jgi:hypothetical protein